MRTLPLGRFLAVLMRSFLNRLWGWTDRPALQLRSVSRNIAREGGLA
jgi:hypothetical protein